MSTAPAGTGTAEYVGLIFGVAGMASGYVGLAGIA
jgi:hypothetical protein